MIARDLVTGLEVGQDRERALEVGQEVVRVERDLRLLWMGGHDCSSVTVLGCALLGAIHPCGAAPALTAVSLPARQASVSQHGSLGGTGITGRRCLELSGDALLGARAALGSALVSRTRKGIVCVFHRLERELRDGAAVLDHGLEALADKVALDRRKFLHRPAVCEVAQALEVALDLLLSQAVPFPRGVLTGLGQHGPELRDRFHVLPGLPGQSFALLTR